MFKDYYAILNVPFNSSTSEVQQSFRSLAKKYHPDKNPNTDTTKLMQEIVEAYLILKDPDARRKYDVVYTKLNNLNQEKEQPLSNEKGTYKNSFDSQYQDESPGNPYKSDPDLDKWIKNAQDQAAEFVKQSIRDTAGILKSGIKHTLYAIAVVTGLFIVIVFLLILFR